MKFWQRLITRQKKLSYFGKFSVTKRQKFVLTSVVLSGGLLAIEIADPSWRYRAIGFLVCLAFFLSAWSLSEGLSGVKWLTTLILPVLFTAGVGLFYFLISTSSWWTSLPIILIYSLGFYALLLTENIFAVAAIRTIQLLRAAHAVGFLLTIVTAFFLYDTILAFRLAPWWNFFLVIVVSFPLLIQALWWVKLEEKITKKTWLFSLVLSLVLGESVFALSFWPLTVSVGSLGLTTCLYTILGLTQHEFSGRLFKRTINEYVSIGLIVLVVLILTTSWGG
jgi:hypothetical protein